MPAPPRVPRARGRAMRAASPATTSPPAPPVPPGAPAVSCTGGTVLANGSATSFTLPGLTAGTTYYYRVCVADNVGNVASGTTASATPTSGSDTTAPAGSLVINAGAASTNNTAAT